MRDEFKSYCYEGAHHTIVINNADRLSKEQTLYVLNKLLEAVKTQRLSAVDSEQIGNKYTHCNWGVCTGSLEVYDKPEMHTFPQDMVDHKRESSLPLMRE